MPGCSQASTRLYLLVRWEQCPVPMHCHLCGVVFHQPLPVSWLYSFNLACIASFKNTKCGLVRVRAAFTLGSTGSETGGEELLMCRDETTLMLTLLQQRNYKSKPD